MNAASILDGFRPATTTNGQPSATKAFGYDLVSLTATNKTDTSQVLEIFSSLSWA
jgi:hypothetical protein